MTLNARGDEHTTFGHVPAICKKQIAHAVVADLHTTPIPRSGFVQSSFLSFDLDLS